MSDPGHAVWSPPSEDGLIVVEFAPRPVPYRFTTTGRSILSGEGCRTMAVTSCRIVCLAADVVRGRRPASALARTLTSACLRRLDVMASLIAAHRMQRDADSMPGLVPVVPCWLSGVFTGSEAVEVAAQMSIGGEPFLADLRLELAGSIWRCTYLDLG